MLDLSIIEQAASDEMAQQIRDKNGRGFVKLKLMVVSLMMIFPRLLKPFLRFLGDF